jgi:hypothetical protein
MSVRFRFSCRSGPQVLVVAGIVLAGAADFTRAAPPTYTVDLTVSGQDDVNPARNFSHISNASGVGANIGIIQSDSLPFDSVGPNAIGGGIVHSLALGFSLPGQIGLNATVDGDTFGGGQAGGFALARANASYAFDVTFSGPGALLSGSIPLNVDGSFFLDGTYGGPSSPDRAGLTTSSVRLHILSILTNGAAILSSEQGEVTASRTVDGNGDLSFGGGKSGLLSGYGGGPVIVFAPFANAPTGIPLRLTLQVQTEGQGRLSHIGSFSGIMDASTDFDSTLGLRPASLGTAFELPPGFTANSVDGNIVDNVWQGVPEPASGLAVIIGGTLALRRRRDHRHAPDRPQCLR